MWNELDFYRELDNYFSTWNQLFLEIDLDTMTRKKPFKQVVIDPCSSTSITRHLNDKQVRAGGVAS